MEVVNIIKAMLQGAYHSVKGIVVIFSLDREINERIKQRQIANIRKSVDNQLQVTPKSQEESKVIKIALQCVLLNGVIFALSCILFECVMIPSLNLFFSSIFDPGSRILDSWYIVRSILIWFYTFVWVGPLFLICKVINTWLFQDIADSAYNHRRGKPVPFRSLSLMLADSLFSLVVQILFVIQIFLSSYIPAGMFISIMLKSLLYSLYSFEYKWCNMGWQLHKRLIFIEKNWPYFIGFGLPLTLLTEMFSFSISSGIFSLLFPFLIISANEANPVIGVTNIPLKVFKIPVKISSALFVKLGKKTEAHLSTSQRSRSRS